MPWHIPEDLKHFKALTMGKPVIMGRKTFDSLGKPLPGRLNIVVSRSDFSAAGTSAQKTVEDAIALAKEKAAQDGVNEIFIIGGGQIYEQALPLTERTYLTFIHKTVDGDTFFPALNENEWCETAREDHAEYSFVTMERK